MERIRYSDAYNIIKSFIHNLFITQNNHTAESTHSAEEELCFELTAEKMQY